MPNPIHYANQAAEVDFLQLLSLTFQSEVARRKNADPNIADVANVGCGCLILIAIRLSVAISNGYGLTLAIIGSVIFIVLILALVADSGWAANRRLKKYLRAVDFTQIHNGHDFEHFIAQKLQDNGIKAWVTPASGDQRVDIIAQTRKGTGLAIQTKLYSRSVSNKAVQEVLAGELFHNCSLAVVVTNNRFTPAAITLAIATGVKLIDFHQLRGLERGTHWFYRS
ncbi:MAG: restriction endonuclease [Candidatus Paceibacterota bacterium]